MLMQGIVTRDAGSAQSYSFSFRAHATINNTRRYACIKNVAISITVLVWSLSLYMGPRARASLPTYKKSDARYDIYALRYTLFRRKWLMTLATIEVLRYTFFWLKCLLNDGGLLEQKSPEKIK